MYSRPWVISRFTPVPTYPLDRKLGGPLTWSERREEMNSHVLLGLELQPLGRPAHSQSLYQLHYLGSKPIFKKKLKVAYEIVLLSA
jgi:hypothetical protein